MTDSLIPHTGRDDMLDALMYATVRIVESRVLPKHPTRKYKVRFAAHPWIVWLSKRFPILPYVEAEYPDDADPLYVRAQNTLYVSPRHLAIMRGAPAIELRGYYA